MNFKPGIKEDIADTSKLTLNNFNPVFYQTQSKHKTLNKKILWRYVFQIMAASYCKNSVSHSLSSKNVPLNI